MTIILGASFVTSLANIEGEESFEATLLGEAETVAQTRISDDELILIQVHFVIIFIFRHTWHTETKISSNIQYLGFDHTWFITNFVKLMRYRIHNSSLTFAPSQGPKVRSAASIILRGPSDMYCDEMERSIHDALCVVKVAVHLFSIFMAMVLMNILPSESSSPSQW